MGDAQAVTADKSTNQGAGVLVYVHLCVKPPLINALDITLGRPHALQKTAAPTRSRGKNAKHQQCELERLDFTERTLEELGNHQIFTK